MIVIEPERIYLQPLCCVSPHEGRQWCEDNVWPVDGECGEAGVEYVRADLIQSLQAKLDEKDVVIGRKDAEITDLKSALEGIRDWLKATGPHGVCDKPLGCITCGFVEIADKHLTPENSDAGSAKV